MSKLASGIFNVLVEAAITATDDSKPRPTLSDPLEDFQAQQIQMEKDKNSPSARSLTAQRVHIHTEFGRVSPLQGLFNMTIISERECGQAGCPAITRSFTEANLIHLAFPVGASNDTSHTLEELLSR